MDQETLNTLMSMVILPLLLALSGFAVAWLRKKTQEITANINDATVRKYVDLASDAVTKAVQTTFQTYVDALKAQGKFDKEAQLTALQKAKDTATALITDEAKRVIAEAYRDFAPQPSPLRSKPSSGRIRERHLLPLRKSRHRSPLLLPPLLPR